MKTYGIFPAFDLGNPADPSVQDCISLVTAIVCESMRAGGDTFHATVDWRDPEGEPWSGSTQGLAEPHIVSLATYDELHRLVRISVDPNSGRSAGVIRSIATCRAATFGWDGQAFLCLRHEDGAPVSIRPELVVIEPRPDLFDTDYFDGSL
jgi:hypothetical protein